MSKTVRIAAALGILVLAVALYVWRSAGQESVTSMTDFDAVLGCLDCGHQFKAVVGTDNVPPYRCAKCGKRAAWLLKQCTACGHKFVPAPEGDPPHAPVVPMCPKCGKPARGIDPGELGGEVKP